MAARKTVTPQTIIGEQGVALIGTRCLEMGFIFHPRRVDHGIDGHIDLVEPGSGARAEPDAAGAEQGPEPAVPLGDGRTASATSAMSGTSTCGCPETPR